MMLMEILAALTNDFQCDLYAPSTVSKGIEVPTLCCCSENGSITAAHLFVQMLKTIDELNAFDCPDGITPFLLLDGHGS